MCHPIMIWLNMVIGESQHLMPLCLRNRSVLLTVFLDRKVRIWYEEWNVPDSVYSHWPRTGDDQSLTSWYPIVLAVLLQRWEHQFSRCWCDDTYVKWSGFCDLRERGSRLFPSLVVITLISAVVQQERSPQCCSPGERAAVCVCVCVWTCSAHTMWVSLNSIGRVNPSSGFYGNTPYLQHGCDSGFAVTCTPMCTCTLAGAQLVLC